VLGRAAPAGWRVLPVLRDPAARADFVVLRADDLALVD